MYKHRVEGPQKCAYPGCLRDGWVKLKGRPESKYCVEHFEELSPRINKLNRETAQARRLRQRNEWINRRNEEEDNTPRRGPGETW